MPLSWTTSLAIAVNQFDAEAARPDTGRDSRQELGAPFDRKQ
jgi:hypothetical protein